MGGEARNHSLALVKQVPDLGLLAKGSMPLWGHRCYVWHRTPLLTRKEELNKIFRKRRQASETDGGCNSVTKGLCCTCSWEIRGTVPAALAV